MVKAFLISGLTGLCWIAGAAIPAAVQAQTLTRAEVESVSNRVELILQGQSARRARVNDVMGVGDALRTAASSQAELRFNDGSLARLGERATFRFVPNTRDFRLSNGTVLLLVPPGRGRTNIQTPNAVTGIQGSGVFCRYDPVTDTTIVGALTISPEGPMVVSNRDGSQRLPLDGGEMAVLRGDNVVGHYRFDLDLFGRTSAIAAGLDLFAPPSAEPSSDGLDGVRAEVATAVESQGTVESDLVNPDFIALSEVEVTEAQLDTALGAEDFAVIPENPFANLSSVGRIGIDGTQGDGPASDAASLPEIANSVGTPLPRIINNLGSTLISPGQPTSTGNRPIISPGQIVNPINRPVVPTGPVGTPPAN